MIGLNSIMIGSERPEVLGEFYKKVIGRPADWTMGNWYGWKMGGMYLTIGEHSEVKGMSKEPPRIMLNFETEDVEGEFKRISEGGAKVIKAPYELEGTHIATFADPDGNYFQLMTPMTMETEAEKEMAEVTAA